MSYSISGGAGGGGFGIALLSHVYNNGQQQKPCCENKARIFLSSDRAVTQQKGNEEPS